MKLHKLEGYIQSIYLVEYPEKILLLDGCSRVDIAVLKTFITQTLQRSFRDLKLVVVTHMHPDHAGAAHKLRDLTGCSIAASNVEGQWYQGFDGKLMHFTDMILAKWVAKRLNKPASRVWYPSTLNPDYKLDDGQALPGFEDWLCISTQGHTDRDISLHHLPTNKIYVADLMVTVKGHFIPPFPVFYPNRYRDSLNKIIDLKPDSIILAHGGEVQPTKQQLQHLLLKSPTVPKTHWRSVKLRIKNIIKRTS